MWKVLRTTRALARSDLTACTRRDLLNGSRTQGAHIRSEKVVLSLESHRETRTLTYINLKTEKWFFATLFGGPGRDSDDVPTGVSGDTPPVAPVSTESDRRFVSGLAANGSPFEVPPPCAGGTPPPPTLLRETAATQCVLCMCVTASLPSEAPRSRHDIATATRTCRWRCLGAAGAR